MLVKALLTAAGLCLAATSANAATFGAALRGGFENPPNMSPAVGYGFLTVNGTSIDVTINFTGLGSGLADAHIHCCVAPTGNVRVAIGFGPGLPLGSTSGSIVRTYDLTQMSTFTGGFITNNGGSVASARAAFLTGLDNGQAYFNLHTVNFPGGEIRGNLALVPEPASWAMMVVGFGLVGGAIRRRNTAFASA